MYKYITTLFTKKSKNKIHNYTGPVLDFLIERSNESGIYGIDLCEAKAIITWVVPGSSAHRAGLLPHDIIIQIDNRDIEPGDTWYRYYMLNKDNIFITVIPSNFIFENPRLKWTQMRKFCKYNNNILITTEYIQSLPYEARSKPIDKLNMIETGEFKMSDNVYI